MTDLSNEIFKLQQIYSAKTVQQLDDIKNSYILDQQVLKEMAFK